VISSGGFFADARWHAMASAMRTEGEGEALMRGLDQVGFAAMMRGASPRLTEDAIAEYWKTLADDERRRAHLELYRSGDFEKLEPYEGCLAALGVPSLILWGARDVFAPVAGAYRLARELPGAELAVYDDAAHFVWEEQPERSTAALVEFVKRHVQVPAES
jgi:haloalkane dehalogenase